MGEKTETVIVNGIVYEVIGQVKGKYGDLLLIRRPKGNKQYAARRLPDSQLYGSNRAQIVTCVGA